MVEWLSTLITMGLILILIGVLISKYPSEGRFLRLRRGISLDDIAKSRGLKSMLVFLTRNKSTKVYRFNEDIIKNSGANMNIQSLYLLKLISLVLVAVVVLLIRYTNIDVIKTSIISKPTGDFELFDSHDKNYLYNASLYNTVLKRVGEESIRKLDDAKRIEAVRKALPEFMPSEDSTIIDRKAASIVKTYNAVSRVKFLDIKSVVVIILSFWLPELFLILKRLLMNSRHKKEVIKLENIFELLGSIRGFKTIHIIDEMQKSSKPYRKCLRNCIDLFKTDRELALEYLKGAVKNKRFSSFVDVVRIYALVDKSLAMEVLERNRVEKEEEALITAEEDVDAVDIIAFISVVPVLLELANLLMKPMLDMIYEAFRFI